MSKGKTCESPTSPGTPVTSLDRMKQWVFEKLQKDVSLDEPGYGGPKRESLSGPVPKIVISGEATRSPRIPFSKINKPSPLKKTWVNYDLESPATNISPTGAIKPQVNEGQSDFSTQKTHNKISPTGSIKKTWLNYSPHSPLSYQKAPPRANSLPVSPADNNPKLFWSATHRNDLETPLHKYIQRNSSASSLPSQSTVLCKCHLESSSPTSSIHSAEESPTTEITHALTRSTSTKPIGYSESVAAFRRKQTGQLRLTGSQSDLQSQDKEEQSKPLSTIYKNTQCARSWSTNLNTQRNSVESSETRKSDRETTLSENDNKTRRRRSSILSIFCIDKDEGDKDDEDTDHSDVEISVSTTPKIEKDEDTDGEMLQTSSGTHYVEQLYKGVPVGGLASMFDMYKDSSEWGSVKVRFQYFNKSRRFQVSLIRGKKIGRRRDGTLRLCVKVCLMPGKLQQKRGQGFHESHDPVLYETFNFTSLKLGELIEKRLRVKFYNSQGLFAKAEPLGEVVVPLFNYDLTAATITWLHLRRSGGQKGPRGELDEFDFGLMERETMRRNSDGQISLYCCSVN